MGLAISLSANYQTEAEWTAAHQSDAEDQDLWAHEGPSFRIGYGGFNVFRHRLAASFAVDLDRMPGYETLGTTPTRDPENWAVFDDAPVAPLIPLFDHSDCDGFLEPTHTKGMASLIRTAAALWPNDRFKEAATDLADLLEYSAEHDNLVIFH